MPEDEWHNGNSYQPFRDLFALVRINDNHFESMAPAYSPGGFNRAFGGHVFAQSGYAASKTVREGFVIHVGTSLFLKGIIMFLPSIGDGFESMGLLRLVFLEVSIVFRFLKIIFSFK
jgi:hypothetical protein